MLGGSSQQWFKPAENPKCCSFRFRIQKNLLQVLMKTLKSYYLGTKAVTQCVNSKPRAYSNICETAGGETHCQSLLLSCKKF